MGIFSKPEIIILKESNSAEEHLAKLEELLPRATGKVKENIQKEIILTKAGIDGEKKVLYELKNSNMDLVVLQDICIRAKDGREAQIDFVIVTSRLMILLECKNLVGNIEIDSKGNFIRTIQYGKRYWKEGIYSPITQNERHMEVLKECKSEEWNAVMGAMVRMSFSSFHKSLVATVYKGNIIKNLIMDCQSYTKYRPNETTGGIFVSWRRKEELPTGA